MLLERTRNETTRVAAVRAWAVVAGSPLAGDLAGVLAALTEELTSYMRKANRVLRTGSVTTLEVGGAPWGPLPVAIFQVSLRELQAGRRLHC